MTGSAAGETANANIATISASSDAFYDTATVLMESVVAATDVKHACM